MTPLSVVVRPPGVNFWPAAGKIEFWPSQPSILSLGFGPVKTCQLTRKGRSALWRLINK